MELSNRMALGCPAMAKNDATHPESDLFPGEVASAVDTALRICVFGSGLRVIENI
jgi:hypothetical protein